MSNDLYVYRDEDQHAVAVARPHTGPNGGFSAHHVAKMALPSKRLTQSEIDGFAALFAAAPDMLEALKTLCGPDVSYHDGEIRIPLAEHGAALNAMRLAREAIAKAEGRS